MTISLFIAKALGLYLLISGVGLIAKRREMNRLLNDFLDNGAASYLSGLVALIIGILLVTNHNVWDTGWQAVISLIAWLTLLKGILRTILPAKQFKSLVDRFNLNENKYLLFGVVSVVLGAYLSYLGFFF